MANKCNASSYMKPWNNNTTVAEIRSDFKKAYEIRNTNMVKETRAYRGIGANFDVLMKLIEQGRPSSPIDRYDVSGPVIGQAVRKHLAKISRDEIRTLNIADTDTLSELYDKLENWIAQNGYREDVLRFLEGSGKEEGEEDEELAVEEDEDDDTNLVIEEVVRGSIMASSQVIFTGAPGTGKTHSVLEFIKKQEQEGAKSTFIQFHPSYDYSDFVEGLRPVVLKGQDQPTFVRMDGIFKAFCRRIVEASLTKLAGQDVWSGMTPAQKYDYLELASTKAHLADDQTQYYFVIDEINRADLSKVFGELMFGLEEDYRGIANRFDTQYRNLNTYRILTVEDVNAGLAPKENIGQAVPLEFDCFRNGFFIPENLRLIGMMNDIDRSVESFDFALRRRFSWIDIKANQIMSASLHHMLDGRNIADLDDLISNIIEMNLIFDWEKYRKFGLTEAYHIAPGMFKNLTDSEDSLQKVFDQKIAPTVKEYTRGRRSSEIVELLKDMAGVLGVKYNG